MENKEKKFKPDPQLKMMNQTRLRLNQPIEDQLEIKAKRHIRPHVVMTQQEVQYAMANLESTHLLMVRIPLDRLLKTDS